MITSSKVSDTSIEITKEITTPPVITKHIYERDFIDSQILAVLTQRNSMIALKDAELAELYTIRDEMDKLGIVAKTDTTSIEKEI